MMNRNVKGYTPEGVFFLAVFGPVLSGSVP
jgi:hypothetical protein